MWNCDFSFFTAYRHKFICAREDNIRFCTNVFVSAEPALTSSLVTSSERSWGPWTRRLSPPGGSTVYFLSYIVFPHWVSQLFAPHQVSQLFAPHQVGQLFYSLTGELAVCSLQVSRLFYSLPGESAVCPSPGDLAIRSSTDESAVCSSPGDTTVRKKR